MKNLSFIPSLLKLTENDKRLIFAILLIVILVFIIIGLLGALVVKIMKYQGKKIDNYVSDVVTTKVITKKKPFVKYARKKNHQIFVKQAFIPLLVILVSVFAYLIRGWVLGFDGYNPFDYQTGFTSLFFLWDFSEVFTIPSDGIGILFKWPVLYNTPHFAAEAWVSYIIVPFGVIGCFWFIIVCQGLLARLLRIVKLSNQVFEKSLDNFNQNTGYMQSNLNQNNPTNGQ